MSRGVYVQGGYGYVWAVRILQECILVNTLLPVSIILLPLSDQRDQTFRFLVTVKLIFGNNKYSIFISQIR